MLECGVDMALVKRTLGWSLKGIVGCAVTHEHKDHAKHIRDLLRNGIPVIALPEVFASQGIRHPLAIETKERTRHKMGNFSITPFSVEHDAPCICYVVEHPEMGKTLFVTDTMLLPYRFKGLNHIMIEANYSDGILQENIEMGIVPPAMRSRLMHSHMELETTAEAVCSQNLANVNEIVLLHLSGQNSDAEAFSQRIERASGLRTIVARPGLMVDFSKEPY